MYKLTLYCNLSDFLKKELNDILYKHINNNDILYNIDNTDIIIKWIYNEKYKEYTFPQGILSDDEILKHTMKLNDDLDCLFGYFLYTENISRKNYKLRVSRYLSKKMST